MAIHHPSVSFLITSAILTGDSFSCFKSIALKRQPKPEIFSVHGRIIRFGPHSFVEKMLSVTTYLHVHVIIIGPVHDNDYFLR